MTVVYVGELVPPGDVSYLYDTDNPAAKVVPTHQPSQPSLPQGTAIIRTASLYTCMDGTT